MLYNKGAGQIGIVGGGPTRISPKSRNNKEEYIYI
jgi:hypothetical protein